MYSFLLFENFLLFTSQQVNFVAIPGYIPFNHASDMVINIAVPKNIHSSTGERYTQLGSVGIGCGEKHVKMRWSSLTKCHITARDV